MTRPDPAAGPTAAPLLSICCFTWNRARLLDRCLWEAKETIRQLPFETELLVLDTGSTDDTPKVMDAYGPQDIEGYRPIHFAERLPEHEALFAAARMARGEFFFWLPDDDRLDPVGLAKAVVELQTDPSAVASFSPQIEVEDGTDKRFGLLNGMDKPLRFAKGDLRGAAAYLLESNYHPEMPLCRTDAFRRHVTRPRKSFLGYWLMLSLLKAGDVQIRTDGFFIHRLRPQGGPHDQVQWTYAVDRMDQHRLAFEILSARAGGILPDGVLTMPGKLSPEDVATLKANWERAFAGVAGAHRTAMPPMAPRLPTVIDRRMAVYAGIAASVCARAGQWQAALEFTCRAAPEGVAPIVGKTLVEMEAATLPMRLAEEIAERFRAAPECDHVLMAGMGALTDAVNKAALQTWKVRTPMSGDRPFLVVDTDTERQWHIGQGVDPWCVVALDDLAAALSIVPGGVA